MCLEICENVTHAAVIYLQVRGGYRIPGKEGGGGPILMRDVEERCKLPHCPRSYICFFLLLISAWQ